MKIDIKDFNQKAQHIIDTVVKPQVERYKQSKTYKMKEIIKGTLPNKKDVLRPTNISNVKVLKALEDIKPNKKDVLRPTNISNVKVLKALEDIKPNRIEEAMKAMNENVIINGITTSSPLHILAFVLLIPAGIVAIPGFCLLLLADHLKKN